MDPQDNIDELVEIDLNHNDERTPINNQNNKPKQSTFIVGALPFIWLYLFSLITFVIPTFFGNVIPLLTFLMINILTLFGILILVCICIFDNKMIQFIGMMTITILSVPVMWVYFSVVMFYKCY